MVIIDNFLEKNDLEYVIDYCVKSSYTYGETDREKTPPTGMIHSIINDEDIYKIILKKLNDYQIIIFLGAGNITKIANNLKKELEILSKS